MCGTQFDWRILRVVHNSGITRVMLSWAAEWSICILVTVGGDGIRPRLGIGCRCCCRRKMMTVAVWVLNIVFAQNTYQRTPDFRTIKNMTHFRYFWKHVVAGITALIQTGSQFPANDLMNMSRYRWFQYNISINDILANLLITEQDRSIFG